MNPALQYADSFALMQTAMQGAGMAFLWFTIAAAGLLRCWLWERRR